MAKTFDEQKDKVRGAVYEALAQIAFELDASEEDMEYAINWFQSRFYEDEVEE